MFEALTVDQKRLIVQLPYRVGLYVSEADQSGGSDANELEKQTLSNIVHGFAEDVMGAESIQHIISTTVALKEQWPEWGEALQDVPKECREAVAVMNEHVSDKDSRAFAVQLFEIGEAVALAFKEHEDGNFIDDLKLKIEYYKYKLASKKSTLREKSFEEYKSISSEERQALENIAFGLGLDTV